MEGKAISYSAQWDGLFGVQDGKPLREAPGRVLDTRQCLPKPSMEAQAREPGARRLPWTSRFPVWATRKLNNWLAREPWSFLDVTVGPPTGWVRGPAGAGAPPSLAGARGAGTALIPALPRFPPLIPSSSLPLPFSALHPALTPCRTAPLPRPAPQTTASILGLHLLCLAAPWTFTWPALWMGAALFFICGGLGIDVSFHR